MDGAQTRRSRVQDAPTRLWCGQGWPHALAKHTDVLRPGDITSDYAASAAVTTVAR